MTKLQMVDSILFALDELGKSRVELERIPLLDIEKHPFPEPVRSVEAVAYNFGRAEQMASQARMWLEFAIKTLEECVKDELAALAALSNLHTQDQQDEPKL